MTETPKTSTRNRNLNAASGAASKRLKAEYPDRWNALMSEEANLRGEPWQPKPDAKAKAKAEFEKLLADNPEFADALRIVEPAGSPDPEDPA